MYSVLPPLSSALAIISGAPSIPSALLHRECCAACLTTQPLPQPKSKKSKDLPSTLISPKAKSSISLTGIECDFSMPSSFPLVAHSPKTSTAFLI